MATVNGEDTSDLVDLHETIDVQMKELIQGISCASDVRLLLAWQELLILGVSRFTEQAVPLVQMTRAGRITALITVLSHLRCVLQNYAGRLEELAAVLSKNELARSLPDGPQPGDVRTVFGQQQVFTSGAWWTLGERREP